jgi:hypothetical protein
MMASQKGLSRRMPNMEFPTMEQVDSADHEQLARWYRMLRGGQTESERLILHEIFTLFTQKGGWTEELSRKIGYTLVN